MQQTTKLNIVATDDQEVHKSREARTTESVELSNEHHYCKSWQIRNMLLPLHRMVVAKIEKIAVVTELGLRGCNAATSLTKKDVGKRKHHCTSSREALLITEASSM